MARKYPKVAILTTPQLVMRPYAMPTYTTRPEVCDVQCAFYVILCGLDAKRNHKNAQRNPRKAPKSAAQITQKHALNRIKAQK